MHFSFYLVFAIALFTVGCGKRGLDNAYRRGATQPGLLSAAEAGDSTYRYAFSGQVLDDTSSEPVKKFSVDLPAQDSAVSSVINALGDRNGMFHISRNPTLKDLATAAIPVVVSASGFEPQVQWVDVGSDCQGPNCPGSKPLSFFLKPLAAPTPTPSAGLSPATVRSAVNPQAIPSIFQNLLQVGKLDSTAGNLLAGAQNKDLLNNILVLLKGTNGDQATNAVSGLLGSIKSNNFKNLSGALLGAANTLMPIIAATNPQIGGALLAVNTLLPYLAPIIGKVSGSQSGPMGQILGTFLQSGSGNVQTNLMGLVNAFQGGGNGAQLAMTTFLPLLQNVLGQNISQGQPRPFQSLLLGALQDPKLMNTFQSGGNANEKVQLLISYLQPLIQGLVGKEGTQIASLLNQFLYKNGIFSLKDFPKDQAELEQFAKLVPFLEPLVRGLNSKDGKELASMLVPLLSKTNPAQAIQNLLGKVNGNTNIGQVAQALFPTIQTLVQQWVPGKQVFTAQLIQGLLNGDFKDLKVVQDLAGSPGLLLSGQARDVFKLAQLPNVEKVIALGK